MGISGLTKWLRKPEQRDLRYMARAIPSPESRHFYSDSHEVGVFKGRWRVGARALAYGRWLTHGRIAVVDVGGLIHNVLLRDCSVWFDFQQIAARFHHFVRALTSCGLRLVLVADGVSQWLANGKVNTAAQRKKQKVKDFRKNQHLLDGFANGRLTRKQALRKYKSAQSFGGSIAWIKALLRFECAFIPNAEFVQCTQECDTAIAEYCFTHKREIFGVFANDSDFFVFDFDFPIFALMTFNFDDKFDLMKPGKGRKKQRRVYCPWQCAMTFGSDIWRKLRLASFYHVLCFVKLKGNDVSRIRVRDVGEAAKKVQRMHGEENLQRFAGRELLEFYSTAPIKQSLTTLKDEWRLFGVFHLAPVNQNWTLVDGGYSVHRLLTPVRSALYCRKQYAAIRSFVEEWTVDEVRIQVADPSIAVSAECAEAKDKEFGDEEFGKREEATLLRVPKPKIGGFMKNIIDIGALVKSGMHSALPVPSKQLMLEESKTAAVASKRRADDRTGVGELVAAMSDLTLAEGSRAEDGEWRIEEMQQLLQSALRQLEERLDLSDFCLQLNAMKIQYLWRENDCSQVVDLRTVNRKLQSFLQTKLPRAIDIHFQSLFCAFLKLFCFDIPLPPIHPLFSGCHYHFVCQSLRQATDKQLSEDLLAIESAFWW